MLLLAPGCSTDAATHSLAKHLRHVRVDESQGKLISSVRAPKLTQKKNKKNPSFSQVIEYLTRNLFWSNFRITPVVQSQQNDKNCGNLK